MLINFENTPLPIHEAFHRSLAPERCLFGAMGSGKTYAIIDEAIAWCLEQPGITGMIIRKTVPELRDTTEPVFKARMPIGLWNACDVRKAGGHIERVIFPNGSIIVFRSLDDWNKHRSFNLGFIAFDECNEIDEESYLGMLFRVRQRDLNAEAIERGYPGKIARTGVWAATNPAGKDWLWRRFHPTSPARVEGCEAFMSRTIDNPFLDAGYVERLLLMPKAYVQRYVLCQFDDFAGRIYEEWGYDTHVVPHPSWGDISSKYRPPVWMAMDPGTENPTAGLWVWTDVANRRLVGVAEYEEPGLAVDVHTRAWRSIEANQRMQVRWRISDPNSITQRARETMISLQTAYAKQGFHFNLGASSDDARIPALAHLIHTRRFVVTPNCLKTFEAIKDYRWEDLTPAQRTKGEDPKQRPLKKNDHLVNCAQWIAGREAPSPYMPKRLKQLHPDPMQDDIHRAIQKNLTTKAKRRGRHVSRHDLGGLNV